MDWSMMRLLVSADIHIGSSIRSLALRNSDLGARLKQAIRDTFVSIVDLAISEQVDAFVLADDLFDNGYSDLRSRAFLVTQLARASEAGVPKVLIRGKGTWIWWFRRSASISPCRMAARGISVFGHG